MGKSKHVTKTIGTYPSYELKIKELEAELENYSAEGQLTMEKAIAAYYKDHKFTRQVILAGKNTDLREEESWSPCVFKKVVEQTVSAMHEKKQLAYLSINEKMESGLADMADLELYTSIKAIEIVTKNLDQFNNIPLMVPKTVYCHGPVGYGLHLFISIFSHSIPSSPPVFHPFPFGNKAIMQSFFVYEVCFSKEEAKQMLNIGLKDLYTMEMRTLQLKLDMLQEQMERNEIPLPEYNNRKEMWLHLIRKVEQKIILLNETEEKILQRLNSLSL